ncbi:hypothetical protein DFP72DRAFT_889237 [Ephemerocybe angulata]|uniref:Uncharacterized protein n=1 Tax=Ephemerocybe angulata TaxID=980116 RepID=A0A8H6I4Q2_9AGAR|nr:hypothetical protein DFP72DRAFT_889237 [Tulosesus angulatus]
MPPTMVPTWDFASDRDLLTSNPWSSHLQDVEDLGPTGSGSHSSSSSLPPPLPMPRGRGYVGHHTTGAPHHRYHTHAWNGSVPFVAQGQVINIERTTGQPIIILIPLPSHSTHHVHRAWNVNMGANYGEVYQGETEAHGIRSVPGDGERRGSMHALADDDYGREARRLEGTGTSTFWKAIGRFFQRRSSRAGAEQQQPRSEAEDSGSVAVSRSDRRLGHSQS